MLIEPTLRSELLAGQVAIVTGGSRGIGGATTTMLAANGARVVIAEVDKSKAAETVDVLNRELGDGRASAYVGDLVAPGVCDALVADTIATCGGLDIVVNNAGYAWDAGVHSMSDDQFQAMLDIHLIVPFRMARACAPHFRAAAKADGESGVTRFRKTVMVSSMAGTWGLVGGANYAAAKAGLLGLMKSLAQEWGSMRVNVNAVAFGGIQTRFGLAQSNHEVIQTGGRTIHVGMPAKQAARMGVAVEPDRVVPDGEMYTPMAMPGAIVLGRLGHIREAADCIFWLCSPLSDYVTGQTIAVNGGARGGMS
jgi:3-oxoacyl-[acyl-carrier protein] reductase